MAEAKDTVHKYDIHCIRRPELGFLSRIPYLGRYFRLRCEIPNGQRGSPCRAILGSNSEELLEELHLSDYIILY